MSAPPENGCGAIGYGLLGLIGLSFAISFCSKQDGGGDTSDASGNYEQAADNLEASAEPTEPLPLDASAVNVGAGQLKLVAALDLPGSRQIFSQNCYDSISKKFDWHQLDRCGGFDALAVRWIETRTVGESELEYFQSEAAATRFLSAATANGLAGGEADVRWANLEASVRKLALPRPAVVANEDTDADVVMDDEPTEDDGAGEDLPAASAGPLNSQQSASWLDEVLSR
jgi:hypothetical protein